jgi:ABC-type uncharacterized transport system substrate-binding protein
MSTHAARTLGVIALAVALLGAGPHAPARIGVVLPGTEWESGLDGLRDGLRGLGYVEGRDVVLLVDNAEHDKGRIATATEGFKRDHVDLLFTITNTALKIVADVTRGSTPPSPPVVFGSASGPVESHILPAYAPAESTITGVTSGSIELISKRLEIVKELLPRIRRVTVIGDRTADSSIASFAEAHRVAPRLGITLSELRVTTRDEALAAVGHLSRKDTDMLFLLPSLVTVGTTPELATLAKASRLPFAVYQVEHVRRDGALLSYGSSYYLQGKQAALLVDKILKGVPVSRLPIERPDTHQLILNLDTAAAIGVRFSQEALNRADDLVGARTAR